MTMQPGQLIVTTDRPLSTSLCNRSGVIVERYANPLSNWTGPVEYLVRFEDGEEMYVAEHFLVTVVGLGAND